MKQEEIIALSKILMKQCNNFWNVKYPRRFSKFIEHSVKQTEESLSASTNKYYKSNGFSFYNSVHYSIFLYYLSYALGIEEENQVIASEIYYLNKIMNLVEWYWAVKLPKHFTAEHPVGSVLGRAHCGDYFIIYQGVTVGGNYNKKDLMYPSFGHHVTMYANSTVLGDSKIGNYVIISANTYIINDTIPDNSIVFGNSPNLVVKNMSEEEKRERFERFWKEIPKFEEDIE